MFDTNIPRIGQIYVLFKAQLKDGIFGAGEESIESRLFEVSRAAPCSMVSNNSI
jgi:hypothetical protein